MVYDLGFSLCRRTGVTNADLKFKVFGAWGFGYVVQTSGTVVRDVASPYTPNPKPPQAPCCKMWFLALLRAFLGFEV